MQSLKTVKNALNKNSFLNDTKPKRYYFGDTPSAEYFTRREVDCLQLIAKGQQTKEIAQHLALSSRTVETHLARIKEKIGYKNTSELIARLHTNTLFRSLI